MRAFRPALLAMAAMLLTACAVDIDESAVFAPSADARRAVGESLALEGEAALPTGVALAHSRLPAPPIGTVATTFADAPGDSRLVVACGGNATQRRTSGVGYLQGRLPFGDVLLFDYPGYGDSEGTATVADMRAAIAAVTGRVRALVAERGYAEVVAWGHSLGGFVCSEMVEAALMEGMADGAREGAPGVFTHAVLETTAPSTTAFARAYVPWYLKPFIRVRIAEALREMDNVEALSNFGGRVLVIGVPEDRQVPAPLHRSLAQGLEDAGVDVRFVEFAGAGHNTVRWHPDFESTVASFLDG